MTSSTYTFDVMVENWDFKTNAPVIVRDGRNHRPKVRLEDFHGHGTFEGKPQNAAFPMPGNAQFAYGTLTLTQFLQDGQQLGSTQNSSLVMPVLIDDISFQADFPKKNLWGIAGSWVLNGAVTLYWKGNQVVITAPSINSQETDAGLSKTLDANGLVTAATQRVDWENVADTDAAEVTILTSTIATAMAPIAGLKVYDAKWVRSGSSGGQVVIDWRMRDSVDNALMPSAIALRPVTSAWVDKVPSIIQLGTNSNFTAANAIANASQGTTNLANIIVTSLTPFQSKVVLEYVDPGITFSGRGTGGGRYVNARMNGTDAQLYVVSNYAIGTSGVRNLTFSKQWVTTSSNLFFAIDRAVVGSVIPRQDPNTINGVALPAFGQVNNATFEGLPALTCLYEAAIFRVKKVASGSTTFYMRYIFSQDDFAQYVQVPANFFTQTIPCTTAVTTSQAWVSAASLGITLTSPTSASFAAFEA